MNPLRKTMGGVHKNICVFGANEIAVSVAAVVACKCRNINVRVVDFNADQVHKWDEKRVRGHEPDLKELLEKCQDQNLSFMTDITGAILMSDIIFLMMDIPSSMPQKSANMMEFDDAARLIAKVSENNKIIVQKCLNAPLRTCESLKMTLKSNKVKKVNFQILAMPELFSSVSPVSYLLNPPFVLIGHEETPEGAKAAGVLLDLYSRWVPKDRIKLMNCLTAEFAKVTINSILAQKVMTIGVIAALCEESGENIFETIRILMKTNVNEQCLKSAIRLGDVNLFRDVKHLMDFFKNKHFVEARDYWLEVLNQNEMRHNRFKKKVLSTFLNTLNNKRFAVFGLWLGGNGKITSELPAINLCASILKEEGTLSLYDPTFEIDKEYVLEAIKQCGADNGEKLVTFFTDPYKAADKAHGIIFCNDLKEFRSLDFSAIFKDMMKPAYIFDEQNILDHECLVKIGFKVKTSGGDY